MAITPRQCAIDQCRGIALIAGPSVVCGRALCLQHATPKWHPCLFLPWDQLIGKTCKHHQRLYDLIARIGEAPISVAALKCRPTARGCNVAVPSVATVKEEYRHDLALGGCNIHVPLLFDDGVRWLARVRLNLYDCDQAESRAMMRSDYEAISALRRVAPESVPKAYMPEEQTDGLSFFFVESTDDVRLLEVKVHSRDKKTIREYADYLVKVATLEFTGIGGLHSPPPISPLSSQEEEEQQGPSPCAIVGPKVEVWPWGTATLGPFTTSRDAYMARIDSWLACIEAAKGQRQDRLLAYLAGLEARSLVAGCEEMRREGPTFIKGQDDYVGPFLQRAHRVAPFTDWECAHVAPLEEAFAGPFALVDWTAFIGGSNKLTSGEVQLAERLESQGRADLAAAIRGGRKYQRLRYFFDAQRVSLDSLNGMRAAFLGDAAPPRAASLGVWAERVLPAHAHNPGLQRLLSQIEDNATAAAIEAQDAADAAQTAAKELKAALDKVTTMPLVDPNDFEARGERAAHAARLEAATNVAATAMLSGKSAAKAAMVYGTEARWALDILTAGKRALSTLAGAACELAVVAEVVEEKGVAANGEGCATVKMAVAKELARWTKVWRDIEVAAAKAEVATSRAEAGAGVAEQALKETRASRNGCY